MITSKNHPSNINIVKIKINLNFFKECSSSNIDQRIDLKMGFHDMNSLLNNCPRRYTWRKICRRNTWRSLRGTKRVSLIQEDV
jgi:hypothetical protein